MTYETYYKLLKIWNSLSEEEKANYENGFNEFAEEYLAGNEDL